MQTLRQFREAFEGVVSRVLCPQHAGGFIRSCWVYILQLGGKRVRPLLCVSGYHFGQQNDVTDAFVDCGIGLGGLSQFFAGA